MDKKMSACRQVLTDTLMELAAQDRDIIAVTSDARGSATLKAFVAAFPEQFVECGIAEQNEVAMAAGLARCGKKPFVCAPAPFLSSRSLEQIKVDAAYSNTNVKLMGVSGGVSYGPLGGSHYCTQDVAAVRAIPGMTVILPADGPQTAWLTRELARRIGPTYVRMGRNPVPEVYTRDDSFEWGRAKRLREGGDLTIIACGQLVYYALQAAAALEADGIRARVLDMYMIKPLDQEAVLAAARETGAILTVEEHSVLGGLGSAVAEVVVQHCPVPMKLMGIPDGPFTYGSQLEMFAAMGLTAENIAASARSLVG